MRVTEQQKLAARKANLFEYLATHHPEAVELDKHGKTLRLAANHSISVKEGYSGYLDFATGEHGNGIDLLCRRFGYDFQAAVLALCGDSDFSFPSPSKIVHTVMEKTLVGLQLPPPAPDYRRMMAYFTQSRRLPPSLVQMLIDNRLLYQADTTNNAIFVSAKCDFAEVRGTLSSKSYHGIVAGSRHDGCWFFQRGKNPAIAFVCESAIDAISLAVLQAEQEAYFISIAGAGKQAAIDRINKSRLTTIIATDNDQAGDECRRRNSDCQTIRPREKDWNDDLKKQYSQKSRAKQ